MPKGSVHFLHELSILGSIYPCLQRQLQKNIYIQKFISLKKGFPCGGAVTAKLRRVVYNLHSDGTVFTAWESNIEN